jgi:hypothetical protein
MRGVAQERDGFVKRRSLRQGGANLRYSQFRRADHKLIRQAQDVKPQRAEPSVPARVAPGAFLAVMARSVDFNNEPPLETDEVGDNVLQYDLRLKLCALASPIADSPPNEGFGLNSVSAPIRARIGA